MNCIDLDKIEVYVDNKRVDTGKYIETGKSDDDESDEDDFNEESPVALKNKKEFSISKIEFELENKTFNFINIGQLIDKLEQEKKFKKIKFYLVNHENCCKKFSILNGNECNYFNNFPFEIIVFFYNLLSKDINKKDLNVDIFSICNHDKDAKINDYDDVGESGYSGCWRNDWKLCTLYITDILIETKDKEKESIIESNDDNKNIIKKLENLENLKDCNVSFIVESKNSDDKNIDVHINFDYFNDETKINSTFAEKGEDEEIMYEFFCKKKIKFRDKIVDNYKPLFKDLPGNLSFIKDKNKYTKDEFVKKIRDDIKNYVKTTKISLLGIDALFPIGNIKIYKKDEYLKNPENKVEIENDKDIIICDEVFVEFEAEDIIKFYTIITPVCKIDKFTCNVKFETSNEKLKDKNLKFNYVYLLSDYLKEHIFCREGFEFVKDINNYKVIYQNKEYNPGQHIDINPKISTDIIFRTLENDDDNNKKIDDQENKKHEKIAKTKDNLNNLNSNISNTSNKSKEELNKKINGTKIEDQDYKNSIDETNVKINEKVKKELESKYIPQEDILVNDESKDSLNDSKEKIVTDLQKNLDNIIPNGHKHNEKDKKEKSKKPAKENNKKNKETDNQQPITNYTNQEVDIKKHKKCSCNCKCKKKNR